VCRFPSSGQHRFLEFVIGAIKTLPRTFPGFAGHLAVVLFVDRHLEPPRLFDRTGNFNRVDADIGAEHILERIHHGAV